MRKQQVFVTASRFIIASPSCCFICGSGFGARPVTDKTTRAGGIGDKKKGMKNTIGTSVIGKRVTFKCFHEQLRRRGRNDLYRKYLGSDREKKQGKAKGRNKV